MTTTPEVLSGPFLENLPLPERFATEAELDDFLAVPSHDLVRDMARTEGDLMILGVGGKMGPTLARLARNVLISAQSSPRFFIQY